MSQFETREGHEYFGYTRQGVYACECGEVLGKGLQEDGAPGVTALKDQFAAHLKEVASKEGDGTWCYVDEIPTCCIAGCGRPAYADAKSLGGPWGFFCEQDFHAARCKLGVGRGQRLVLRPKEGE